MFADHLIHYVQFKRTLSAHVFSRSIFEFGLLSREQLLRLDV